MVFFLRHLSYFLFLFSFFFGGGVVDGTFYDISSFEIILIELINV